MTIEALLQILRDVRDVAIHQQQKQLVLYYDRSTLERLYPGSLSMGSLAICVSLSCTDSGSVEISSEMYQMYKVKAPNGAQLKSVIGRLNNASECKFYVVDRSKKRALGREYPYDGVRVSLVIPSAAAAKLTSAEILDNAAIIAGQHKRFAYEVQRAVADDTSLAQLAEGFRFKPTDPN